MALESADRIHIRELGVRCIVGVNPDERTNKQDVFISITLEADLRQPGQTDNIADTIDYKTLKKRVFDMVEKSSFYLIEALAQAIADICLEWEQVKAATVTVDKPGALRFAKSVAVEITRRRAEA
jgi:FolB domain-containing protein